MQLTIFHFIAKSNYILAALILHDSVKRVLIENQNILFSEEHPIYALELGANVCELMKLMVLLNMSNVVQLLVV